MFALSQTPCVWTTNQAYEFATTNDTQHSTSTTHTDRSSSRHRLRRWQRAVMGCRTRGGAAWTVRCPPHVNHGREGGKGAHPTMSSSTSHAPRSLSCTVLPPHAATSAAFCTASVTRRSTSLPPCGSISPSLRASKYDR